MKRICLECDKEFEGKGQKYGYCAKCKAKIVKDIRKKSVRKI